MKHTYRHTDEYGIELKTVVSSPYSVISTDVATPDDLGTMDGIFEARIWGLASFVPQECGMYAIFGSFERDDRHVRYSASTVYDGDEMIHDPFSEMMDDIEYLMNGQATPIM